MRRNEALRLLREHRVELESFGIKSLAIFGSTARDEAGPESDVDILVEFEGTATFDRYAGLLLLLEELLGREVDLLTQNAIRERIRPYIEAEALYVT